MKHMQADLFAEDSAERNKFAASMLESIRERLLATLARLEAAKTFPWSDPLDAIHEENRFQRGADMLGQEGTALWARFDAEMDRLYATQQSSC